MCIYIYIYIYNLYIYIYIYIYYIHILIYIYIYIYIFKKNDLKFTISRPYTKMLTLSEREMRQTDLFSSNTISNYLDVQYLLKI